MLVIPDSPVKLGLPGKFIAWRDCQKEAVREITKADRRVIALNLPTGSGKSLVYMAAAKMLGGRTAILTATKALQAQLMRDFSCIGLAEIKGRANYPCYYPKWLMGSDALCSVLECDYSGSCPYHIALRIARQASLVV
ncbi:MAG: DEAD/DEAH box helicase family protein, partial [Deltaproteobacteria bacterium]|nr:DEAD/DEAH box helicase family protein [Deltaproteobacteria bacterium]